MVKHNNEKQRNESINHFRFTLVTNGLRRRIVVQRFFFQLEFEFVQLQQLVFILFILFIVVLLQFEQL